MRTRPFWECCFDEWRGGETAVTDNDLREMGLKPSPLFDELLEPLLAEKG